MKRKNILWLALDLVFLIVFNTLFFLIGKQPFSVSVWISYAFVHLAYLLIIASPFLTKKGTSFAVFGATTESISVAYFFITFIVNLVFILIGQLDVKWVIIVNVVITGLYTFILLINLIFNDRTNASLEKKEIELQYVRGCSARIRMLIDQADNKQLRKKLETAYDIIHTSPVNSTPNAKNYEVEVLAGIGNIEDAFSKGDNSSAEEAITAVIRAANSRNNHLK